MSDKETRLVLDFTGRKIPEDAIEMSKHGYIVIGDEEPLRPKGRSRVAAWKTAKAREKALKALEEARRKKSFGENL